LLELRIVAELLRMLRNGLRLQCLGLDLHLWLVLGLGCSLLPCCDAYCTEQLCTKIFGWNKRRLLQL